MPVPFNLHAVCAEPVADRAKDSAQRAFSGRKYGDVVHVARVMRDAKRTNDPVERLKRRVCEPLRRICSNANSVRNNAGSKVEHLCVLDQFAQASHNNRWRQTRIKVPDVALEAIARAARVARDPAADRGASVRRSPPANGAAGVRVHAAHHDRLQNPDERVMDVLIRPLARFVRVAPFLRGGVVTALDFVRRGVKIFQDRLQFFDAFGLCQFDPRRAAVGVVVIMPVVRCVYLVDRRSAILRGDEGLPEIVNSVHRDLTSFWPDGFPCAPACAGEYSSAPLWPIFS